MNALMKKIILIICLWITTCQAEYQYDLSICMIFRDEAPYLKEWIEFHRLVGVEHFYLCSHNSRDNYKKILKPYIKDGIVELKELEDPVNNVEEFNQIQYNFYNKCLKKAKHVSKWVAFIDSDEFLFPVQESSLVNLLNLYEAFGGVAVNWQMFGTSYVHQLSQERLMIEQLTHCAPLNYVTNQHVKSIVQPIYTNYFANPHYANYCRGYAQVNSDNVPFAGPFSPYIQVNQLRINHYWMRDENYFWNYKVPRQVQFWGVEGEERAKRDVQTLNAESDYTIQRFVPKLRKKMGLEP